MKIYIIPTSIACLLFLGCNSFNKKVVDQKIHQDQGTTLVQEEVIPEYNEKIKKLEGERKVIIEVLNIDLTTVDFDNLNEKQKNQVRQAMLISEQIKIYTDLVNDLEEALRQHNEKLIPNQSIEAIVTTPVN